MYCGKQLHAQNLLFKCSQRNKNNCSSFPNHAYQGATTPESSSHRFYLPCTVVQLKWNPLKQDKNKSILSKCMIKVKNDGKQNHPKQLQIKTFKHLAWNMTRSLHLVWLHTHWNLLKSSENSLTLKFCVSQSATRNQHWTLSSYFCSSRTKDSAEKKQCSFALLDDQK